ncbi:hypothetical protein [Desulfatitalea alkaliphila]|uniref:Uncharacterized protein n=1 Tax=Desulfatitalea alkaliphila TaxID=2929485 RepID=A0AA41RE92_9BACT|nr:hypothetical protein [Desulfatitalea alkaliphila]MCJ8503138.1 hypothetical protein [Desulfatitalea alkaliphila]
MNKTIEWWQVQLGFWGGMAWVVLIILLNSINMIGIPIISLASAGYILGVLASAAGYIFFEIFAGRSFKFIAKEPKLRIVSLICLAIIALFAFIGFIARISHDSSYFYIVFFIVGCVIANRGIWPFLNYMDEMQH